jgi:hypothetical protein
MRGNGMILLSESDTGAGTERVLPTLRRHVTDLKHRWKGRYRTNPVALALQSALAVFAAPRALNNASITRVSPLAKMLAVATPRRVLLVMPAGSDWSAERMTIHHYAARTRTHPP